MVQRFSYWHNALHCGKFTAAIFSLLLAGSAYAQGQPAPDKIKADIKLVQNAVNDVVGLSIPGWGVLQGAKAAYLDGYGIVVNVEIAFDPPVNPFSPQRSPEEVRRIATQKRSEVQEKLTNVLKREIPTLASLASAESVSVILNVLNTNPAYMPDMPAQIILTARKQEPERVNIREY